MKLQELYFLKYIFANQCGQKTLKMLVSVYVEDRFQALQGISSAEYELQRN